MRLYSLWGPLHGGARPSGDLQYPAATAPADDLAVLTIIFIFVLGPLPRGGPGGGSGLSCPLGDRGFRLTPARTRGDIIFLIVYLGL